MYSIQADLANKLYCLLEETGPMQPVLGDVYDAIATALDISRDAAVEVFRNATARGLISRIKEGGMLVGIKAANASDLKAVPVKNHLSKHDSVLDYQRYEAKLMRFMVRKNGYWQIQVDRLWPSIGQSLGVDPTHAREIFERAKAKQLVLMTFPKKEIGGRRMVDVTFGPAAEAAINLLPTEPVVLTSPLPKPVRISAPKPAAKVVRPKSTIAQTQTKPKPGRNTANDPRSILAEERRDKIFRTLCAQPGGEIISRSGAVSVLMKLCDLGITSSPFQRHVDILIERGLFERTGFLRIAVGQGGRARAAELGVKIPPPAQVSAVLKMGSLSIVRGSNAHKALLYLRDSSEPESAVAVRKANNIPVGSIYQLLDKLEAAGLIESNIQGKVLVYKLSKAGRTYVSKFEVGRPRPKVSKRSLVKYKILVCLKSGQVLSISEIVAKTGANRNSVSEVLIYERTKGNIERSGTPQSFRYTLTDAGKKYLQLHSREAKQALEEISVLA